MSTVDEKEKAAAEDTAISKQDCSSNSFEGKVVSMTGDRLVMTSMDGKEYSHSLAKDAKLTCDGTDCKAEDLKAGSRIRVTTTKNDRNVVTGIEFLGNNSEFAQCCS